MKTQKTLITLGLVAALTFIAGCGSKNESQTSDAAKDASTKADSVATEAGKAIEAAKPAAEQAVKDARVTTTAAASDASAKANALIDQAKSLMGESKYSEALNTLQQVSSLKLTPEQEKLVASLKDQIQKAMAAKATTDGAGAVGNLLKK